MDPRSREVGHLIVRYRAGDVIVVVGHRDKDEPVIMSVQVDTGHTSYQGTRASGGATGSTAPNTMRELRKRVLAEGYRIEQVGAHAKVLDKETGSFLMSLPLTPSDHRSIPNCWAQFTRLNRGNQERKKRDQQSNPEGSVAEGH